MPLPAKSPERELAEQSLRGFDQQERRSGKALLIAEAALISQLRKSVRMATGMLLGYAATGASKGNLSSEVKSYMTLLQPRLQRDFFAGMAMARDGAASSVGVHRLIVNAATAVDESSAAFAAASLASSWAATAMQVVANVDVKRGILGDLTGVSAAVDPRLRVGAVTQSARAFGDERELMIAVGSPYRTVYRDRFDRPSAKAYKIWSAFLDGKTCERCFRLDGTIVEFDKPFPSGPPPLHPHCRCEPEFLLVTKPERLEDISIDYDLFKQEVRDVIREGRVESGKHALQFASESLGYRRSPLVIADRFRRTPYERRDVTVGEGLRFAPHPKATSKHTTLMVDVRALDKAWRLDDSYYIPAGGGGSEIGGRRAEFAKFLKSGKPIQASKVSFDAETGRASFIDGRHRFSVMRDQGISRVAITIEKLDAKTLPTSWNARPLSKKKRK